LRGTPLDRFSALEYGAGLGPGRSLAAQLRYLGGRKALTTALRTFPQTTEQLLHVDKFLERERALPVTLPATAGGAPLVASETFGELDVRSLLRAFNVPGAVATADGWGGGRLALYGKVAVIMLRWDTPDDAVQWQAAVPQYVAAAFPGETGHTCPPLDRCWSGGARRGRLRGDRRPRERTECRRRRRRVAPSLTLESSLSLLGSSGMACPGQWSESLPQRGDLCRVFPAFEPEVLSSLASAADF
jgi:hypothetical protein